MSKGAYNIGREVGEVGILERDSGEESGGRWRQTAGKTGASLSRKRGHGCRFSGDRDSPSLCTQRPWDLLLENGNSRPRGRRNESRFEDPRNRPTTDWLDKAKGKRRNKDGGTAANRQEVGRIKAPPIVFTSRDEGRLLLLLWLGFRKLITIRGVGGLARNRIGDPGKNFIRRGRRSGASRSLLTGA